MAQSVFNSNIKYNMYCIKHMLCLGLGEIKYRYKGLAKEPIPQNQASLDTYNYDRFVKLDLNLD